MEDWKKAFTKELDSFERLNVKTDVWENTLDLRNVEILPGKVVMVKKPIGDGTHLKKGRVVVCGDFQQVQPGEETCANTPSFPMLRTLISLASLQRWAVASWDVSTAFLYAQLPEDHVVYCRPPNALIRLGLEHGSHEETKKQAKELEQAKIGACIVNRQAGSESSSLDSTQDRSVDNSAVLTPVCLACQEGQDQVRECESMCIMFLSPQPYGSR